MISIWAFGICICGHKWAETFCIIGNLIRKQASKVQLLVASSLVPLSTVIGVYIGYKLHGLQGNK